METEPFGTEAHGEWSRCWHTLHIDAYRTGWRGAWDAFKAALLRCDRLQVPKDLTYSVYIKSPADEVYVWGAQTEESNGTP